MSAELWMSNLGLLGFSAASVAYLAAYSKGRYGDVWGKIAFTIFVLATLSETAALFVRGGSGAINEVPGIVLAATIAWISAAGHIFLRMKPVGAFVAPLATLILLLQFFLDPSGRANAGSTGAAMLVGSHVSAAILGQAFAIFACAISILFLWQQYLLKQKMLNRLPASFPALDKLDRLLLVSLWIGFGFITVSLLTGALYSQQFLTSSASSLGFKILWAIVIWLWYLSILLAKNVFNLPVKQIARMSLAGFVLLAISLFGIGFFRLPGGI